MSRLSRRTLFTGAAAAASLAAIGHVPGVRLIRAQGAAYEIVSFGPVQEGVLPEGDYRPDPGSFMGISAGGIAFGSLAASADKFSPILADAEGSLTKLKSGEFGGAVRALNSSGVAVGVSYENAGGQSSSNNTGGIPAAWIDGELTRLSVPDPANEWDNTGGTADSISDDGAIFGSANGYELLWVNGEAQILPDQLPAGGTLVHRAIAPNGTLIGYITLSIDNQFLHQWGAISGSDFEPFGLERAETSGGLVEINSASEVLLSYTPTDLPVAFITGPGLETIAIDVRSEGVFFSATGFNTAHDVVGSWRSRRDLPLEPALWQDGAITPLSELLPTDHGFSLLSVSAISDDGIISASGWDADGGFHPMLFVPA